MFQNPADRASGDGHNTFVVDDPWTSKSSGDPNERVSPKTGVGFRWGKAPSSNIQGNSKLQKLKIVAFIRSVVLVNCMCFGLYMLLRLTEPRAGAGPIRRSVRAGWLYLGSNWVYLGSFGSSLGSFWVRFLTIVNNDGQSLGSFFGEKYFRGTGARSQESESRIGRCRRHGDELKTPWIFPDARILILS
jgi:hypothetical protein